MCTLGAHSVMNVTGLVAVDGEASCEGKQVCNLVWAGRELRSDSEVGFQDKVSLMQSLEGAVSEPGVEVGRSRWVWGPREQREMKMEERRKQMPMAGGRVCFPEDLERYPTGNDNGGSLRR